jgi:hypothetical protein
MSGKSALLLIIVQHPDRHGYFNLFKGRAPLTAVVAVYLKGQTFAKPDNFLVAAI